MLKTQKDLELAIVRMAERFPTRIGPKHWGRCDNHCLIGQIFHDAVGGCYLPSSENSLEASTLALAAAAFNDAGVPWGEIPKRLGLVPGEAPVEAPAPHEVSA
jgi:hypothetical protein